MVLFSIIDSRESNIIVSDSLRDASCSKSGAVNCLQDVALWIYGWSVEQETWLKYDLLCRLVNLLSLALHKSCPVL